MSKRAVRDFCEASKLAPDGVINPATRSGNHKPTSLTKCKSCSKEERHFNTRLGGSSTYKEVSVDRNTPQKHRL